MGIKAAIYGGIIIALLLAARLAYTAIFDAGWNAAIVEQEQLISAEREKAVVAARKQWENVTSLTEREIVVEERIVEIIREVEKEIPTIVERIVTVHPECSDLGDSFAGLLNAQVRAGASNPLRGATPTAEPD